MSSEIERLRAELESYKDRVIGDATVVRLLIEERNEWIQKCADLRTKLEVTETQRIRLKEERDGMDEVIDEENVAVSCINPTEDLRLAIQELKRQRDEVYELCAKACEKEYHTENGFGVTAADQRCAKLIRELKDMI